MYIIGLNKNNTILHIFYYPTVSSAIIMKTYDKSRQINAYFIILLLNIS